MLLVVAALTAGTLCAGFAARDDEGKWFSNSNISTWHWADKQPDDGEQKSVNNRSGYMLMSFNSYGLEMAGTPAATAANAENTYKLTATVLPEGATRKALKWTIEFENAESEWAQDKEVSDFVTLSVAYEGAVNAQVSCLQPFAEPIIVTATALDGSDCFATCTCDYLQKITNMNLTLTPSALVYDTTYTVEIQPEYGVGTVKGEIQDVSYSLALTNGFKTAIENNISAIYNDKFRYKSPASFTTDYEANTFSLTGTPYDTFCVDVTSGEGGGVTLSANSVAPLAVSTSAKSPFNTAFPKAARSYTQPHAVFTFSYKNVYGGITVNSSVTAELKFDADSLAILVTSVVFNTDNIVFYDASINGAGELQ